MAKTFVVEHARLGQFGLHPPRVIRIGCNQRSCLHTSLPRSGAANAKQEHRWANHAHASFLEQLGRKTEQKPEHQDAAMNAVRIRIHQDNQLGIATLICLP